MWVLNGGSHRGRPITIFLSETEWDTQWPAHHLPAKQKNHRQVVFQVQLIHGRVYSGPSTPWTQGKDVSSSAVARFLQAGKQEFKPLIPLFGATVAAAPPQAVRIVSYGLDSDSDQFQTGMVRLSRGQVHSPADRRLHQFRLLAHANWKHSASRERQVSVKQ